MLVLTLWRNLDELSCGRSGRGARALESLPPSLIHPGFCRRSFSQFLRILGGWGSDWGSGGASMTVSVQGPKRRGLMIGDEQVRQREARVDLDRSHQIPSGSSIRSEKGANGEKLLRCEVRESAVKSSPWAAALRAAAKSKSQNLVQSGCHCFPCVPSASWRQY